MCSPEKTSPEIFGDQGQPLTTNQFVIFRRHWKIFNTAENVQGHQWQRRYDSAQVDKNQTNANSAQKL